jgi:phosphatidylinositol glycan class K
LGTATAQQMLLPAILTYLLCIASWILGAATTGQTQEEHVREFFGKDGANTTSSHTNNWAVLVCASRYWFNYRVSILRTAYILNANI